MGNKDLLTVREVAEIAGVSVQAVYNRLEKDFKPYLKIENGKKRLDSAVLKLFNHAENSTDFKPDFKPLLNLLEKQNEQLQKELEIKNKQIEELSAALVAAQQTAQAAQQTAQVAQALHAGTMQQQLSDGGADMAEQDQSPSKEKKKRWWRR